MIRSAAFSPTAIPGSVATRLSSSTLPITPTHSCGSRTRMDPSRCMRQRHPVRRRHPDARDRNNEPSSSAPFPATCPPRAPRRTDHGRMGRPGSIGPISPSPAADTLRLDLPGIPPPSAWATRTPRSSSPTWKPPASPISARGSSTTGCSLSAPISASPRSSIPNIRLKVWERGAGLTLACGSGACATLVNAHRRGLTHRRATVIARRRQPGNRMARRQPRGDDRPCRNRVPGEVELP